MKQKRLMAGALRPSGLLRTGAAALALLVLSACSFGASQTSQKSFSDTEASSNLFRLPKHLPTGLRRKDDADLYTDWSAESPVYITFKRRLHRGGGGSVSLSGSRATITQAGTYVVSGSLADGQLLVDAGQGRNTIRIVLKRRPHPLFRQRGHLCQPGRQADSLPGARHRKQPVRRCRKYLLPPPTPIEPSAALFSKNDMTINGAAR